MFKKIDLVYVGVFA